MKQRKKQPVQTRQAILEAAGAEFSCHGYAGSGIGSIVAKAGLTKGALFHHFADKRTLCLAWVGENLAGAIDALWIAPLGTIGSLDGMRAHCRALCLGLQPDDAMSALVTLAAETAASDPQLGAAMEGVFAAWRAAIVELLERGRLAGWIHRSIQPGVEAAFLVSAFCGFSVAAKCAAGESTLRTCAAALEGYLETLRAQPGQ